MIANKSSLALYDFLGVNMADNSTATILPQSVTTATPEVEQYLFFIYLGVGFLVLLIIGLSVVLFVFVIKRNRMIRRMHPKHDLAYNLHDSDALARYYSLGVKEDGGSTLKSTRGTLTGKQSLHSHSMSTQESIRAHKPTSIHSPNHDSYVVKSNPLYKDEDENINFDNTPSDNGYSSQGNTGRGTIRSQQLGSLDRDSCSSNESLNKAPASELSVVNSSGSSFEHIAEIHDVTPKKTDLIGTTNFGYDSTEPSRSNRTSCSSEMRAVNELDLVLGQGKPTPAESAFKKISISRRAQISLNRDCLPPNFMDDESSGSSGESETDEENTAGENAQARVISEGTPTKRSEDKRRAQAKHAYENTDPFNDNAPVKPPKPASLSNYAKRNSAEQKSPTLDTPDVSQQAPAKPARQEPDRLLPPPPPVSLPPPMNVDSDNESTLTVHTAVYEDVDVTSSSNPQVIAFVKPSPVIPAPPPLPQIMDDASDCGDKPYGTVYTLDIPPPPEEITTATPESKTSQIIDDGSDCGDKPYGTVYTTDIPTPPPLIILPPQSKTNTPKQALSQSQAHGGIDNGIYDPMQFDAPSIIQGTPEGSNSTTAPGSAIPPPEITVGDQPYENMDM